MLIKDWLTLIHECIKRGAANVSVLITIPIVHHRLISLLQVLEVCFCLSMLLCCACTSNSSGTLQNLQPLEFSQKHRWYN